MLSYVSFASVATTSLFYDYQLHSI